jgi:hypothetical protein
MPRDAFPGYDDPVNIEGEPEDVPKVLLGDEVGGGPLWGRNRAAYAALDD